MALKKLLRKQHDVEKNFNIKLHLLECKYNKYYMDIYNKVKYIIIKHHVIILKFLFC